MDTNHTSLKDRLLAEIKKGDVVMHSRVRYVAALLALAGIATAILFLTVFIVNIIFFTIRVSNHEVLLGFGSNGVWAFLWYFPWVPALIDGALVLLLQWLVRKFKFGYSTPIVFVLGALVVGAGAVGFIVDRATPFNDRVFEGREHLPPLFRGLYEDAHHRELPGSGICRCTVISIEGNTLLVEDTRDATSTLTVILPPNDARATTTGLKVGDVVFIAGHEEQGVIEAFGVRKSIH